MDKRKAIEYIIIQLESLEADLKDMLIELDFTKLEYLEIKENACKSLQNTIISLGTILKQ